MEECEALCGRVGILANGQLRCLGPIPHLKSRFGRELLVEVRLRSPTGGGGSGSGGHGGADAAASAAEDPAVLALLARLAALVRDERQHAGGGTAATTTLTRQQPSRARVRMDSEGQLVGGGGGGNDDAGPAGGGGAAAAGDAVARVPRRMTYEWAASSSPDAAPVSAAAAAAVADLWVPDTVAAIDAACAALGDEARALRFVAADKTAWEVCQALRKDKGIRARDLCAWWVRDERAAAVDAFVRGPLAEATGGAALAEAAEERRGENAAAGCARGRSFSARLGAGRGARGLKADSLDEDDDDGGADDDFYDAEDGPAGGAELVEQYGNRLAYRLSCAAGVALGQVFGLIEARKDELGIEEYSVAQTTLEQIFNQLAKRNT
jgi:hypothetical protein